RPVFSRRTGSRWRPNERFSLTRPTSTRDGERAARSTSSNTRGYAAHAVTLRPSGLTGDAMVRRAYRQRSLVEVLLPDSDQPWEPGPRRIATPLEDDVL